MNILLTGASRGIGAATHDLLISSGHKVAGHSTKGGNGLIAGDLANPASINSIWDQALDALEGRIDVLVNNAGIYEAISDDASDDQWRTGWARTLQVNLHAAADLCRQAVGHFRHQGGGRIVNVASRAAFRGDSPRHWHYAYAAENILAFAVAPGFTVSDMTDEYLQGRGGESILVDIPLGRVTATTEVAEAIRWLAIDAPPASTGSVIDLNGASYVR